MNNLQQLLTAYRLLSSLTRFKNRNYDTLLKSALFDLKSLIVDLVTDDFFIRFCGKLSEKE